MTKYIKCGGGGLPPQVLSDMEAVLNKKFGTSTTYPSNTWPDLIRTMIPLPEKTASGSIAHFSDGADTVPLKSSKFYITPTQASGTPTPSNPLPISGHTGLTITRTGANIFGGSALKDGIVASMPSATVDTVNKTVTFSSSATTNQRITDGYISGKFKENTQYTFILALEKTSGVGSNLRIYYTDGTYTAVPNISTTDTKEIKTVVSTSNKTVNFLSKTNQAGSTVVYYDECGIFEGTLTESDFDPYSGTTYPVSWSEQGTVYGGYFKDGELWKTHEVVDLGSLSWIYTNNVFRGIISDGVILNSTQTNIIDFWCSCYLVKGSGNSSKWASDNLTAWHGTGSSCYIYVNDTAYNDADIFKTSVTGQKLVYELATPVKVADLEEVKINSLLGVNNIWCDTGDCEVEYRADIELSLNE